MSRKTELAAVVSTDEARFAEAYIEATLFLGSKRGAAALAVKRAGLTLAADLTGDPREQAEVIGAKYLGRRSVQGYIKELQQDIKERTTLPWDRVLQEVERIALSNIGDFLKPREPGVTGVPDADISGVPVEALSVIASITHTPTKHGVSTKVQLHDKMSAIQTLSRIHGKFLDNVNMKLSIDDLDKLIATMQAQLAGGS